MFEQKLVQSRSSHGGLDGTYHVLTPSGTYMTDPLCGVAPGKGALPAARDLVQQFDSSNCRLAPPLGTGPNSLPCSKY